MPLLSSDIILNGLGVCLFPEVLKKDYIAFAMQQNPLFIV